MLDWRPRLDSEVFPAGERWPLDVKFAGDCFFLSDGKRLLPSRLHVEDLKAGGLLFSAGSVAACVALTNFQRACWI